MRRKSAAIKPGIYGTQEIIEQTGKNKWKIKCLNCGRIFERNISVVLNLIKTPRKIGCEECFRSPHYIGETIGIFTVIKNLGNNIWELKCNNCGKNFATSASSLARYRKSLPKYCKFCEPEQHVSRKYKPGTIINFFELIEFIGSNNWKVKCTKCGKEQIQTLSNIKRLKGSSCFYCKHPDVQTIIIDKKRIHYKDIGQRMFENYRSKIISDNNKGGKYKEWELTQDEYLSLVYGNCHYCGKAPSDKNQWNIGHNKRKSDLQPIKINGIDRLDSNKGYTLDNCVSCCSECNQLKSTLSVDVFIQKIKEIYNFYCSTTIEQHSGELSRVDSSESKQEESFKD